MKLKNKNKNILKDKIFYYKLASLTFIFWLVLILFVYFSLKNG